MKEVVKIREGTVPFFRLKRGSMLGGEERVDGDFASGRRGGSGCANMMMGQGVRVAQIVCADCTTRYSFRRPGEISIGAVP
jgi:hypothetical protein